MKRNIDAFFRIFYCFAFFFAFLSINASAQQTANPSEGQNEGLAQYDSIEISLLTCEPHEEVYSLYGHTALRIFDKVNNRDIAINYGVFDSRDPNFVPHFIFGQTDYTMEMFPMIYFFKEYEYCGSAVKEQILNLSREEKMKLVNALFDNYRPENKDYRYNFFYNNCTTKARDIILNNIDGKISYKQTFMQQGERSFRDLIHWKNKDYPWAAVGNDLLLGVEADKNTTMEERQFLPEILMADFEDATIICSNGTKKPLVKESRWILQHGESKLDPMPSFPVRPGVCSLIVLFIIIGVTVYEKFKRKKTYRWVNWTLFTAIAIPGFVLVAMLFSEHPTVKVNCQLLLFNPLWLLYCPLKRRFRWVNIIAAVMLALFFVCAFFQEYAEGVTNLACCLLVRLYYPYEKK